MKLGWFAVATIVLAAELVLGCSPDAECPPPGADIDTLRAALRERDELERTYLLTSYLRGFGPEDVQPALAEIEAHRVGFDANEVQLLMLAWTRFDGQGAFEAARAWPGPWSDILTAQAMRAWGFNDGRAALAAWKEIDDEELAERLRGELVGGWVASADLDGVTEFAATVPEPRRRNRLAFRLVGQTMRDGPDAVIAWADSLPVDTPNEFKTMVFAHAAAAVARVDPERAASWYEREMKRPYTTGTLRAIASKWAQYQDPKSAVAWIEALPLAEDRESERADSIRAAFRVWAVDAPDAAEAWLASASPSASRDWAIDEFTRATLETSPEKALGWLGRIDDEGHRRKATLRYARLWLAEDPEAARSWLAASDLPADLKAQIPKAPKRATGPSIPQPSDTEQ